MEETAESNGEKKIMSPCDVEALKKCLEENKGDYVKCQSQIEAFKSSCSLKKPSSSLESKQQFNSDRVNIDETRAEFWLKRVLGMNSKSLK
ncbi:hypothetical protein WN943_028007 [Citrus x changshan-huyou]